MGGRGAGPGVDVGEARLPGVPADLVLVAVVDHHVEPVEGGRPAGCPWAARVRSGSSGISAPVALVGPAPRARGRRPPPRFQLFSWPGRRVRDERHRRRAGGVVDRPAERLPGAEQRRWAGLPGRRTASRRGGLFRAVDGEVRVMYSEGVIGRPDTSGCPPGRRWSRVAPHGTGSGAVAGFPFIGVRRVGRRGGGAVGRLDRHRVDPEGQGRARRCTTAGK